MPNYLTRSYAKINLGLFIRERLPNGYHDIETGFVFIDWSDRMEVYPAEKTTIMCDDASIPTGKDNLIVKAIQAFNLAHGLNGYYHIKLDKKIPSGAGLGGGSSNAASMLHILNKINGTETSPEKLAEIGAALGADVPVFVHSKTAIGSGTGTQLEFGDFQPDYVILTVFPGIHSDTKAAYQQCKPLGAPSIPLLEILTTTEPDEWDVLLRNDLEPPVISLYHEIGNLRDQLMDSGALYAAMSGSGSSVFGIFEQEFLALEVYQYLLELGYKANLTKPGFTPDNRVYLVG